MTEYKTSIVIVGSELPGAIVSLKEEPKVGETITVNDETLVIEEIVVIMPAHDGYHYLHLTCRPKDN